MYASRSLVCNNIKGETHDSAFTNTVCWTVLFNVPFALDSAGISAYLPISRCWRGANCSTSWTNFATFDCDLDCYLCSSSLIHRNSCTMYGWLLTLDARFLLNRPWLREIQEKQTTWSIGSASWSCFYICETSPWCFERFIG